MAKSYRSALLAGLLVSLSASPVLAATDYPREGEPDAGERVYVGLFEKLTVEISGENGSTYPVLTRHAPNDGNGSVYNETRVESGETLTFDVTGYYLVQTWGNLSYSDLSVEPVPSNPDTTTTAEPPGGGLMLPQSNRGALVALLVVVGSLLLLGVS